MRSTMKITVLASIFLLIAHYQIFSQEKFNISLNLNVGDEFDYTYEASKETKWPATNGGLSVNWKTEEMKKFSLHFKVLKKLESGSYYFEIIETETENYSWSPKSCTSYNMKYPEFKYPYSDNKEMGKYNINRVCQYVAMYNQQKGFSQLQTRKNNKSQLPVIEQYKDVHPNIQTEFIQRLITMLVYPDRPVKINHTWYQYNSNNKIINKLVEINERNFIIEQTSFLYPDEIENKDSLERYTNTTRIWIDRKTGMIAKSLNTIKYTENMNGKTFVYSNNYFKLNNLNKIIPKTFVYGHIQNASYKTFTITNQKYPFGNHIYSKTYSLDDNNNFSVCLEIDKPLRMWVECFSQSANDIITVPFYLIPGDSLKLEFDENDRFNTLKFNGLGSINNNLLKDFLFNNCETKNLDSLKNSLLNTLNNNLQSVDYEFYKYMYSEIICDYYNNKILPLKKYTGNYPDYNSIFPDSLNIYKIADENSIGFRTFNENFAEFSFLKAKTNKSFGNKNFTSRYYFTNYILSDYPLYLEMVRILEDALYSSYSDNYIEPYFKHFIETCQNLEAKELIINEFERYKQLQEGSFPPQFLLKDENGNTVSLNKFKGKVLVISLSDELIEYYGRISIIRNSDTVIVGANNINDIKDINKDDIYYMNIQSNPYHIAKNKDNKLQIKWNYYTLYDQSISFDEFFFKKFSNNNVIIISKEGKIFRKNYTISTLDVIEAINYKEPINYTKHLKSILYALFLLIIGGTLVWLMLHFRTKQTVKKEQLKRHITELELKAIRSQMNPHFIYNSLNSIQNLVLHNKNEEAHSYLSKFAELIRMILKNSEKDEIPLSEELKAINTYIELESLRFSFRYTPEIEEGIDTINTLIPGMVIQPLVENAIIHGLYHKEGNKELTLKILHNAPGQKLQIIIEDNGIGRAEASRIKNGQAGLSTKLTQERFKILNTRYKEQFTINIEDKTDEQGKPNGTKVEILIPDEV